MAGTSKRHNRRNRTQPLVLSLVSGAVCFSLVLGALYYATRPATEPTIADTITPATPAADRAQSASDAETVTAHPNNRRPAESNAIVESPTASVTTETADANSADKTDDEIADPAAELEAQLVAGEFGPALETIKLAENDEQRVRFLKMVADAQIAAGEFDSSRQTTRRMPPTNERAAVRGERAARESMAGGGVDIEQLVELIQNNTGDPEQISWEVGGGIGTIDTWDPSGQADGGVRVDPNGLLYQLTQAEQEGRLEALAVKARQADLNDDMAQPSTLRLVSLTRLEREVARRLAEGRPVLTTMKHLAGLSQVRYVFVYPKIDEIVIGGPAESWEYNEHGIPVGVTSGRPTLQLDDLVTVLRTFADGGAGIFRCSIDPREEGVRKVQQFVNESGEKGSLRVSTASSWARRLEQLLGPQDVTVEGVPAQSRVARVIVEADYRMKLIGVDKLQTDANIPSYFDLQSGNPSQNAASIDALRWWLTMKYDAVLHSPDRDVFEIQGSSVLCQSENEMLTATGQRNATGTSDPTNRSFARQFTERYAELAAADSIFADLQNIFDLALVAALVRREGLDDRARWGLGVFAANGAYRPAEYEPAETAMSVANHRVYGGRHLVVQVAGGVRGDLVSVLEDQDVVGEASRLSNFSKRGRPVDVPANRWWWDAAE